MKKIIVALIVLLFAYSNSYCSETSTFSINLAGSWNATIPGKFSNRGGYTITQNGAHLVLEHRQSNWRIGALIQPDNVTIRANDGGVGFIRNCGRKIEWSNNSFWEKSMVGVSPIPSIDGGWNATIPGKFSNRGGYKITQNGAHLVLEHKQSNWRVEARIQPDNVTIRANDGGVGLIRNCGRRIEWSNNSFWNR